MSQHQDSRRNFLKSSAAGAAGLALTTAGVQTARAASAGWSSGLQIHPTIDNLRVVYCHDDAMRKAQAITWVDGYNGMVSQNNAANADRIKANLDTLARALSQIDNADTAWATLLRKHPDHAWSDVKAAIKINALGCNHPRVAVVEKVCLELIRLGVRPANISIYDVTRNAETLYANYVGNGLPAGVIVTYGPNGSSSRTYQSFDVTSESGTLKCTTVIQNVDILVNVAVNKNHGYGGATLTMKNHAGTITHTGNRSGICPDDVEDLCAWNKTDAIIGTPDHQQDIPARQQLCIIDSIWASTSGGPGAIPDTTPGIVMMGCFGPAMDFLCVHKIRKEIMQASHSYNEVMKYMTRFDYSQETANSLLTQTPEENSGRGWVDATRWAPLAVIEAPRTMNMPDQIPVTINAAGLRTVIHLAIPGGLKAVDRLGVYGLNGRPIAILSTQGTEISWNGTAANGRRVGPGMYAVSARASGKVYSRNFVLMQ